MYLSLSTWLFEHLDVPDMVRRVRRCGYENVEISGARAYAEWDIAEVARACADAGVTVRSIHCVHHAVRGLEDDDRAYGEYHETFFDRIACLRNVIVIEHIRFDPAVVTRTQERLHRLAERYAEMGFTLSTENMGDRGQAQWDILRQVLTGPVHLTLDPKHAAVAEVDPLEYFEFADRIVNIHVLDHYARAALGDWIPVGTGEIDWPAIIARLRDIGYAGPLTVELNEPQSRRVLEVVSRAAAAAGVPDEYRRLLEDNGLEETFAVASRRTLERLLGH